ncbi:MAG: hypothetical protein ACRCZF_15485, partial [Gemmataceae bacterium]
ALVAYAPKSGGVSVTVRAKALWDAFQVPGVEKQVGGFAKEAHPLAGDELDLAAVRTLAVGAAMNLA